MATALGAVSLLLANGWSVESESPFGIRHDESGSFATGLAADAVASELLAELADGPDEGPELTHAQVYAELQEVLAQAKRYRDVAKGVVVDNEDSGESEEAWETAFNLVFSDEVANRATRLLMVLRARLDYTVSGGSYEVQVNAYVAALGRVERVLHRFFC